MAKRLNFTGIALAIPILISASLGIGLVTESARADDGDKWYNPYLVETFIDKEGRQIDMFIVPGRPPEIKAKAFLSFILSG